MRAPRGERGPLRSLVGTLGPRDLVDVLSLRDPAPVIRLVGRRLGFGAAG
jgi:hypothetical protein